MKKLVIIPAFNESASIERAVDDIRQNAPGFDYIVINDCSTDDTLEVCRKNGIKHVNLSVNLGIGGAVQTGYLYGCQNGYDLAVQFDGDGQHDASYLEQMAEEQKKAVLEAVASAPADRRAVAISDALQNVIAKGGTEAGLGENASSLEKLSWTHEMKTDDQVILATAKMANKGAADSVSKVQEMTQTSDRISGTSETVDDKKYADREDAEEGKQM